MPFSNIGIDSRMIKAVNPITFSNPIVLVRSDIVQLSLILIMPSLSKQKVDRIYAVPFRNCLPHNVMNTMMT